MTISWQRMRSDQVRFSERMCICGTPVDGMGIVGDIAFGWGGYWFCATSLDSLGSEMGGLDEDEEGGVT